MKLLAQINVSQFEKGDHYWSHNGDYNDDQVVANGKVRRFDDVFDPSPGQLVNHPSNAELEYYEAKVDCAMVKITPIHTEESEVAELYLFDHVDSEEEQIFFAQYAQDRKLTDFVAVYDAIDVISETQDGIEYDTEVAFEGRLDLSAIQVVQDTIGPLTVDLDPFDSPTKWVKDDGWSVPPLIGA